MRVAANIAEEPLGDILLTMLDAGWVRIEHGGRAATEHQLRALFEGPAVADVLCTGAQIGIDGAELVVVAARRKADWRVGTAVIVGPEEEWFRIASIEERTMIAGCVTSTGSYGMAKRRRPGTSCATPVAERTVGPGHWHQYPYGGPPPSRPGTFRSPCRLR